MLQYYQTVYVASTILAVLGFIAVGLGVWLLVRHMALSPKLAMTKNES